MKLAQLRSNRLTAIAHKLFCRTFLVVILATGCASIGHEFPTAQVSTIRIGVTTQNDIYTTFGTPWRTGLENGMKTWTYGDYRYGLLSESSAEDLVIKFDPRGIVASYVFNTSKRSK